MFYSQFILAKKGPLGTIWIAAHLERKLRKNQVAETDIGVSVDSILFPEVPIALRLSGHLLLGVVRVYSRQVNYLFNDCSETLLKIKQAFQSTAVDLPPEATTAPFHSITLPETFDFDELELFPENEGAPLRPNGNFVDHHVTSREHITLQDNHDNNFVLGSSQFGLDERFGDGNCSSMGLDFDEEFLSGKTQAGGPSTSAHFSDDDDGDDPMDLDTDKGHMDEPYSSPGNEFGMSRIDLNEERGSSLFKLNPSEGGDNQNRDSVFDEERITPVFGFEQENEHHSTSNLSPLLEPLDEPISNKISDSAIFKSDTPNFHTYTPCTPDLNQEFCPPDEASTPAILEGGKVEFGKSQTPENSELNVSHCASPMLGQVTPSSPLIQIPPSSDQQMGNENVSLHSMQMSGDSDSSLQTAKDSVDTFQGFQVHKVMSSENNILPEPQIQVSSLESSQQGGTLLPNQNVSSNEVIKPSNSVFQGFPVQSSIPADGTRDAQLVQNSLTAVPSAEAHLQASLSESNHQSGSIPPFQGFQSMQASSVGGIQQFVPSSNATQDLNSTFQGFPALNPSLEPNLQPSLTERNQLGLPMLNTQNLGQQTHMQGLPVENTSFPTQAVGHSIPSVRAPQDSVSSFQGFSVQKDVSTSRGDLDQTNLSAMPASVNNQFDSTFHGFHLHKDILDESGRNAQTNFGALSQTVHPSFIGNAQPDVSLLPGQSFVSAKTAKDTSSSFQGFPLHKDVVAETSGDSLREDSHPVSPIRRPNDSPTSSLQNIPKTALFQQGSVSSFQEAGFISSPSRAPYQTPSTFQQQMGTSISPQNLGPPAAWGTTIHTSAPMQNVANYQVSSSQPMPMLPPASGSMQPISNDPPLYMRNLDATRQASWHPAGQQPSTSTLSPSGMGPIETLRSAANPSREDPGMMLLQKNMLYDRIPALEMAHAEMRKNMTHMQPFQPQLDQTPILREETPFDQIRKSPSSSRNFEPLPGDDDVLASILGRKRSNVFNVASTPKENQVAKKPRVASKSMLKKRKIEMDPMAVLHGDIIRQQLEYTGDIRRDRKKAPCTRREVWSFEKEVQGQQNFDEPSLIGLATELQDLYGEILGGIELKVSMDLASSQKTPTFDASKKNQANPVISPAANADSQRVTAAAHVEPLKNTAVVNEQGEPIPDTTANADSENEEDAYGCPGGFESDSDLEELDRPQIALPEGVEMTSSQIPATVGGDSGTATVDGTLKESNPNIQNDKAIEGQAGSQVTEIPLSTDGKDPDVSIETEVPEGGTQISVAQEQAPESEKDTCDLEGGEAEPKDIVDISMSKERDALGEAQQPEPDKPVEDLQQICSLVGENQEEIKIEGNGNANTEGTKMLEDQNNNEEKPDQVLEITDQEKSKEPVKIIDVDEMKIEDADGHVITDAAEEKVDAASDHENSDFFVNDDNADFLADDADDEDIAYTDFRDDDSGDDQHEIQENSGWSLRTRNVGRYLKNIFEGMESNIKASEDQQQNQNRTLGLERLLGHKTKKEAARMFFETLVLKTRDYIQVEQKSPYEDIHLYPQTKLMKTNF